MMSVKIQISLSENNDAILAQVVRSVCFRRLFETWETACPVPGPAPVQLHRG